MPTNTTITIYYCCYLTDCSACPKGFYLVTECTHDTDRICSPCSSCKRGQFVYELCRSDQDTLCQGNNIICSSCIVVCLHINYLYSLQLNCNY